MLHLGDLTLSGADEVAHLRYARRQLDRLPVPWMALPGNHDVGDNPVVGVAHSSIIDEERRWRWLDEIGPDRWTVQVDGWTVVGANAQLFGSGLAAEAEQWEWLTDEVSSIGVGRSAALALHKPMVAPADEVAAAPPYRFVPRPVVSQLVALSGERPFELVMSGHVHQFRVLDLSGTRHLWCPTTWAVLPDRIQPRFGFKRCGYLSLRLAAEQPASVTMVEPDGVRQLTIGDNTPYPYQH